MKFTIGELRTPSDRIPQNGSLTSLLISERLTTLFEADPDPFGLHGISLEHRLECINNHIRFGYWAGPSEGQPILY